MKKCILIGALAALMLFAFTACEQQMPNLPASQWDLEVAKVTFASSSKGLYEGEAGTIVAKFNVEYKNGTSTKDVIGNLTYAALSAGVNTAEVQFTADGPKYVVEVTAQPVTGLKVTFNNGDLTIPYTSYQGWVTSEKVPETAAKPTAVVATYADGHESTKALTANDVTAKYNSEDPAEVSAIVVSYGDVSVSTDITVKRTADAASAFAGLEVTYTVVRTGETEPVVKDASTLSGEALYVNDVVYVTVTKAMTDEDDNVVLAKGDTMGSTFQVTKDITGYSWNAESGDDYKGTYKFTLDSTSKSATINFYDAASGTKDTATIDIPKGATVITVGTLSATQNDEPIAAGTNVTASDLAKYVTFTGISKNDGDSTTTDTPVAGTDFQITFPYASSYKIPASDANPSSVKVYFVVSYDKYGETTYVPGTVDLTAKAE